MAHFSEEQSINLWESSWLYSWMHNMRKFGYYEILNASSPERHFSWRQRDVSLVLPPDVDLLKLLILTSRCLQLKCRSGLYIAKTRVCHLNLIYPCNVPSCKEVIHMLVNPCKPIKRDSFCAKNFNNTPKIRTKGQRY